MLSAILHAVATVVLLTIRLSNPPAPVVQERSVTLVAPNLPRPPKLQPVRQAKPRPQPRVEAPVIAARSAPREFRPYLPSPPPAAQPVEISAPPPLAPPEIAPAPVAPAPRAELAIALPKPITTGVLSDAKVTTSPAVPAAQVRASGFGTAQTAGSGAPRGTTASVGGFGSASAAETPRQTAALQSASFGEVRAAAPNTPVERRAAPAAATPVEIVSKPRPAYTPEARSRRIEGEVTIEVLFTASGEARVLRVIEGLGHGLNETATAAARAIVFRPATRSGAPVDATAIVRIVFQLAY